MARDPQHEKWNAVFAGLKDSEPVCDDWLDAYAGALSAARDLFVIDLGCGSGNDTKYLLERGYRVTACDYSGEAIERVRRLFPQAETRLFDMRDGLPFPDASTRAIVADLSLHYFPWETTRRIAAEIARILPAGGLFLCRLNSVRDVNHGAGEGEEIERHYYRTAAGPKRFFDEDDVDSLFTEGWLWIAKAEKRLSRYEKEKSLWELALRRTAAGAVRTGLPSAGPLRLRPHHILDIVRNVGNGREAKPHEYGHLVHLVTDEIVRNPGRECRLVVGSDDVCGPCARLSRDGRCDDVLAQLDPPLSKQAYNDELDRRLLAFFGLPENRVLRVSEFLALAAARLDEVVKICTHPKEDERSRREGLGKGILLLGINGRPGAGDGPA